MLEVTQFKTHDNAFSLKILRGNSPVDLIDTGVSRVVVNTETEQIDSDVDSAAIDYTTQGASGIIIFDFADLAAIVAGDYICSITIFDTLHTAGQVFNMAFKVIMREKKVT